MFKSYSFYSSDLNINKYNLLLNKAQELLNFKNNISQEICKNFIKFIDMSKFDWITHFRTQLPHCNNQDISNAISDVYDSYENKRNKFIQNLTVKHQKDIKFNHYKNGNVKNYQIIFESNKFSQCLTYLCRYWHETFIDWLQKNIKTDSKKEKLRTDALNLYNKFPNRIKTLIENKRNLILSQITEHPIQFKSLSFRSCTEMKDSIINRNKNIQSIFGAILTIGGQKTNSGKLFIPVKYNQNYHGLLSDYDKLPNKKGQKNISYTICFDKNKIRIVLLKKSPDEIPITNKLNYYGIDVNIKNNLFADKLGNTIDYDRKLFNNYVNFLQKLDKKQSYKNNHKLNTELNKKDTNNYKNWQIKIKNMLKQKANTLVKQAISLNKNHIVLEDLEHFAKSFITSEEFQNFKYSRLVKMLNLGSIKNIIKSIAYKHGIQVSFIHAYYTSQTCHKCGCITRNNRKSQENFCCINCGYTDNADKNAAENIENRLAVDVLRNNLLLLDNGSYLPKKFGKETVLSILHDYYSNNLLELNKLR